MDTRSIGSTVLLSLAGSRLPAGGRERSGGRMVLVLAIERHDFEKLLTFGAVEVESEDGGDEPYEGATMSPCWAWEAVRAFPGIRTLH